MRCGDYREALRIYRQLADLMPGEATWAERCAGACHELRMADEELAYLRQALELQVDDGDVLAAIATCKQILEIDPDHPETLDTLHLLYSEPVSSPAPEAEVVEVQPRSPSLDDSNAPLLELELTDVIPGARAVQLPEGDPGGVAEIPLELPAAGPDQSAPLDLHLEDDLGLDLDADLGPELDPELPSDLERANRPTVARSVRETEQRERSGRRTARDELASTPLFGSLPAEDLRRLVERVRVVRLSAGEVLFREGDAANTLYVVVDGAVVPIAEGSPRKRLAVLENGEFFGEIGLVTGQPRNATVEALVDCRLLAIDRKLVWSLLRGRAEVSRVLLRFLRQRLVDRHIRTSPFFQAFAHAERSDVARQFRFLEIKDGTRVVEQGTPPDGLFVLLAGEMKVVDEAREKPLGQLEAGDLFGGVPLLQSEAATSSVLADGKCWVLELGEGRFRKILDANPRLEALLGRLAKRMGGERYLI
jgi:CRP-like cAMP-binding protein